MGFVGGLVRRGHAGVAVVIGGEGGANGANLTHATLMHRQLGIMGLCGSSLTAIEKEERSLDRKIMEEQKKVFAIRTSCTYACTHVHAVPMPPLSLSLPPPPERSS